MAWKTAGTNLAARSNKLRGRVADRALQNFNGCGQCLRTLRSVTQAIGTRIAFPTHIAQAGLTTSLLD